MNINRIIVYLSSILYSIIPILTCISRKLNRTGPYSRWKHWKSWKHFPTSLRSGNFSKTDFPPIIRKHDSDLEKLFPGDPLIADTN